MSGDSVSSSQEADLLGSPTAQELEQEISDAQAVHQKLLQYSEQVDRLILPEEEMPPKRNKGSQQAPSVSMQQEIPLPPPTQSELWTETEEKQLEENRLYFEEMANIAARAKKEGPMKLPKRPKRKIEDLFKEKEGKKKRVELKTPTDLHNYLLSNQADVSTAISREAFSDSALFVGTTDENEIVKRLQRGIRNLKRENAQTIMFHIQFGGFLILCKDWYEKERKEGRMKETWAKWLKEKTGYSDFHVRRLRALARVLKPFPKFYTVGLPVNFIMSKLHQIENMLQIDEYREYWSHDPNIPVTSHLQQSQS